MKTLMMMVAAVMSLPAIVNAQKIGMVPVVAAVSAPLSVPVKTVPVKTVPVKTVPVKIVPVKTVTVKPIIVPVKPIVTTVLSGTGTIAPKTTTSQTLSCPTNYSLVHVGGNPGSYVCRGYDVEEGKFCPAIESE